MEKIISFQNIEVAPYIVEQLLDVRIDQQMNEHGTFYFKALPPPGELLFTSSCTELIA